jgi:hypothetical protein
VEADQTTTKDIITEDETKKWRDDMLSDTWYQIASQKKEQ